MQPTKTTPNSDGMVPSAAVWHCLQWARYNASCSRTNNKNTNNRLWI